MDNFKKKRFTYLFCSKEIRVRISEVFILFAFIYLEKLTWCMFEGQKATCGSWFSPSVMSIPGTELQF